MSLYKIWLSISFVLFSNLLFAEDWSMLNKNLSARLSPIDANFNFYNVSKYNVGVFYKRNQHISNMLLIGKQVYLLDKNNNIVHVDLYSNKKYTYKLPKTYKNLTPKGIAYNNNTLYISFLEGFFVAYSLNTKTLSWEKNILMPIISAPIIDGKSLLLASSFNLLNFDAATGESIWSTTVSNGNIELSNLVSPTVYGNFVFLGTTNSGVLVINKSTGEVIKYNFLSNNELFNVNQNTAVLDITSPITMLNKNTLLIIYQNKMIGYNLTKGEIIWQQNSFGSYFAPYIINRNNIIVASSNNELYSVDGATGNINWRVFLKSNKQPKTGILIWYYPILINNKIMIINSMGEIIFLNKENGGFLSSYNTYSSEVETISTAPVVTQDNILLLSSYGNLYRIKVQ